MTGKHHKHDAELTDRLKTASSFQTHLANVIAGINHEVAPWLGGAQNTGVRLLDMLKDIDDESDVIKCQAKVQKILYALEQATNLLSMLSSSVKRLQNYSLVNANVGDTIKSWVRVTLTDRLIKNMISNDNIEIQEESLGFKAEHSPMLLSQVILNLAKNSIEHNQHMLKDLKVKIYGIPHKKTIVYEDNGKGIEKDLLNRIFSPGITSKKCHSQSHGLGLSACMDYCMSMGASIWAKSEVGKYTRFTIKFEKSYETARYEPQRSDEYEVDEMFKLYEEKRALNLKEIEQEESNW